MSSSERPTAPDLYPCPCCGHLVFGEPPGTYGICLFCWWEDDQVQLAFPTTSGANGVSLIEAQENYRVVGCCQLRDDLRNVAFVPEPGDHRDPAWRPIDLSVDRFLNLDDPTYIEKWQRVMGKIGVELYYWRDTYWLRNG